MNVHLCFLLSLVSAALLLSACEEPREAPPFYDPGRTYEAPADDNYDKLMEDQFSYMGELTAILNDIADGKLPPSDGSRLIRAWGKKGEVIMTRKKQLQIGIPPDELQKIVKKHAQRSYQEALATREAMERLKNSGNLTEEIRQAALNVKN